MHIVAQPTLLRLTMDCAIWVFNVKKTGDVVQISGDRVLLSDWVHRALARQNLPSTSQETIDTGKEARQSLLSAFCCSHAGAIRLRSKTTHPVTFLLAAQPFVALMSSMSWISNSSAVQVCSMLKGTFRYIKVDSSCLRANV